VYVDDIIVTSDDEEEQQLLSQHLSKEFEIKTLGKLKYFSGIELAHSKKGILLSQHKYIIDLLEEIGKIVCKPTSTLIDPNLKLGNAEGDILVDKGNVPEISWQTHLSHTRLDLAFVASLVNQFVHQPKETRLYDALRIVQYMKGTPGKEILFK